MTAHFKYAASFHVIIIEFKIYDWNIQALFMQYFEMIDMGTDFMLQKVRFPVHKNWGLCIPFSCGMG